MCFVGDGINDTIALKKADVAVVLKNASAMAVEVAQVVLMDDTLARFDDLFRISAALEENLKDSLTITLVPTAINLSGAFLFDGFGLISSHVVKKTGLVIGLRHAMSPLKQFPASEPPALPPAPSR